MSLAELVAAIQLKERLNPGRHVTRIRFNEEAFKLFIAQRNNAEHITIAATSDHEVQEYYLGIPYDLNAYEVDYTFELSE